MKYKRCHEYTIQMATEKIGLLAILILVLGLSASNFAVMEKYNFFYPNAIVMYGIEPVREMFPNEKSPIIAELQNIFEANAADYFGTLQKAKYNLGCYSAGDQTLFDGQTGDAGSVHALSATATDVTAKLNTMQTAVTESSTLTVCTCIDDITSIVMKSGTTSVNQYEKQFQNRADANPPTNLDDLYDRTKLTADAELKFNKYLVEACAVTSEPVLTTKFEGVMNIRIMIWVGQIFLVTACLYELSKPTVHVDTETGVAKLKRNNLQYVLLTLCTLILMAAFILWFVYSMHNTNHGKQRDLAFRSSNHTSFQAGDPITITFILLFIALLVTYVLTFVVDFLTISTEEDRFIGMNQMGYLNFEFVSNLGWALLILSLGIQAKKKNLDHISTSLILIFTVGVLRFVSRSLHDMYNRVCNKLTDTDIVMIQTLSDKDMKAALKVGTTNSSSQATDQDFWRSFILRRYLRQIGMLRCAAFFTIIVVSVVLILTADVTAANSFQHSKHEGQYFLAVVAFLLYNLCSDFLLEMMPLHFEDDKKSDRPEVQENMKESLTSHVHTAKYYVLALFLLWLNVIHMTQWRHEIEFLLEKKA